MGRLEAWWLSFPPAVRLAVGYMAIIMIISIGFSTVLYRVSSAELMRQSRRPAQLFVPRYDQYPDYNNFRDTELSEGLLRLRRNLLFLNLGTLIVGGAASYYLAKRTLQPIEEALDAQTRFTGDASHELRTPLTAMQSEIEVALRNHKLTKDDAVMLLESNLEEVGKLRALSDGLLRLARADKNTFERQIVQMQAVIEQATKRVEGLAAVKNISVKSKLKELTVAGDMDSLVELVVILLDNAIKYSQPDTSVEVTARRQGHNAVVEVKDQGRGIKAADLPYIFERFYRADTSRSKDIAEGYGLGLSIAQKITDLHNGVITARSDADGSTFTVKLPLVSF